MKYTVERIEDNIAVLEDEQGKFVEVASFLLPENTKSGNVLLFENERYSLINAVDEERQKRILDKYQKLFNKNKNNF
ncbi:MAG: DUF3006 domain-containing protein [Clostridia bacterium]|nr:DUF3006 domain-containing protein [Clostridia bacterium]